MRLSRALIFGFPNNLMTEIIDFHVHFFPPAVFRAIWRYFEVKSRGFMEQNMSELLKRTGLKNLHH